MQQLPDDVRMESPYLEETNDGLKFIVKTIITTKGEVTHELKPFTLSVSKVGSDVQIGDLTGVYDCVALWMEPNPRLTKNKALESLYLLIKDESVALEFKKRVDGKW